MNAIQIDECVQSDDQILKYWLGVFPSDKVPSFKQNRCCYIANLDKACDAGSHWVCFFRDGPRWEFFDSYGLQPDRSVFPRVPSSTEYNTTTLQSTFSAVCGQYAIFFLYLRCRGYTMRDVTRLFCPDSETNDLAVCDFVDDHFTYTHSECSAQTCHSASSV